MRHNVGNHDVLVATVRTCREAPIIISVEFVDGFLVGTKFIGFDTREELFGLL